MPAPPYRKHPFPPVFAQMRDCSPFYFIQNAITTAICRRLEITFEPIPAKLK